MPQPGAGAAENYFSLRFPNSGGKRRNRAGRASGEDNRGVQIAQKKEPYVKKIIRVLIASLLLAGSLSVYSVADGGNPTPCSPVTRVCG